MRRSGRSARRRVPPDVARSCAGTDRGLGSDRRRCLFAAGGKRGGVGPRPPGLRRRLNALGLSLEMMVVGRPVDDNVTLRAQYAFEQL